MKPTGCEHEFRRASDTVEREPSKAIDEAGLTGRLRTANIKFPARYTNPASLARPFEQIVSLIGEDDHVIADGVQFLIDHARQTQKITEPAT